MNNDQNEGQRYYAFVTTQIEAIRGVGHARQDGYCRRHLRSHRMDTDGDGTDHSLEQLFSNWASQQSHGSALKTDC